MRAEGLASRISATVWRSEGLATIAFFRIGPIELLGSSSNCSLSMLASRHSSSASASFGTSTLFARLGLAAASDGAAFLLDLVLVGSLALVYPSSRNVSQSSHPHVSL